jgi:hypothetical protein
MKNIILMVIGSCIFSGTLNAQPDPVLKVREIDKIVQGIHDSKTTSADYVYYDEQMELWKLSVNRDAQGKIIKFGFALSGPPEPVYVEYYLNELELVCMIERTEMRQSRWNDEWIERFYLEDNNLFYYALRHNYKDYVNIDTGYVRQEFTEEDNFPIWGSSKDVEYLLVRCIPEEDFLLKEDFTIYNDGSRLINGSEKADFVDRTSTNTLIVFRETKEKKIETDYQEANNETVIRGYLTSENDQFQFSVKRRAELVGVSGKFVFLEADPWPDNFQLKIYNESTMSIEFDERVYDAMIKGDYLFYLKEVELDRIEHLFAHENCILIETDELDTKRCGVFKVKPGEWKETFTNQVFCVLVNRSWE